MKKLLTVLLTLFMIITLVGCDSNDKQEEQPISQEDAPIAELEVPEEEPKITGGWTEAEDQTITEELKEIFDSALNGLLGATYEPVKLLSTQVVNGINYKFLANGTKTTNPITKGTYNITINKSTDGTISLLDIEVIEEKQEEVKQEETVSQDITSMYFWVVFYDQFGNELQREAVKYGTVPTYHSDIPYFDDGKYWYKGVGWTDKKGNVVSEFKPITGNTRFYAIYEECGQVSHEEPAPVSEPAPSHVCSKTSTYLLYIIEVPSQFEAIVDVYEWDAGSNSYSLIDGEITMSTLKFSPMLMNTDAGKWIHTNNNSQPNLGNQQLCDDYEAHTLTCFVAGTQVQYNLLGHTKNIEDFKVGDQIVSYDVNTNKYYLAKVGNVFVHDGRQRTSTLADIILEDGSTITMTPNHPVLTTAGFRAINNNHMPKLMENQFVMGANGWTKIKEIKVYDCEPTVTYNLGIIDYDEIVDNDTYDTYVAGGIVVHNLY